MSYLFHIWFCALLIITNIDIDLNYKYGSKNIRRDEDPNAGDDKQPAEQPISDEEIVRRLRKLYGLGRMHRCDLSGVATGHIIPIDPR